MPHPADRGRLRVYLGAAPGVGKTYAMLDEGRRRVERGTDLVVGYVETHGRPKTESELEGLEVVPRAKVAYRGTVQEEMDLDAILGDTPTWCWSTSSPTPTCRAASTRSAGRTSRRCSTRASR